MKSLTSLKISVVLKFIVEPPTCHPANIGQSRVGVINNNAYELTRHRCCVQRSCGGGKSGGPFQRLLPVLTHNQAWPESARLGLLALLPQ